MLFLVLTSILVTGLILPGMHWSASVGLPILLLSGFAVKVMALRFSRIDLTQAYLAGLAFRTIFLAAGIGSLYRFHGETPLLFFLYSMGSFSLFQTFELIHWIKTFRQPSG